MIILGKYKEIYADKFLPSIKDRISETPFEHKERVLSYLKSKKADAVAAGRATDVLTGKTIPGEFSCYTDGVYAWRSDLIYYVEKYNLNPGDDFINHVLGR